MGRRLPAAGVPGGLREIGMHDYAELCMDSQFRRVLRHGRRTR